MTLVVAIGCSDGLVMAADSASSEDCGTKQPVDNKIKRLGNLPLVYGTSGSVGVIQKIDEGLAGFTIKNKPYRTSQELKRLVVPVLKEALENHVSYPQAPYNSPPCAITLFAWVQDGKPWILEIERNGNDQFYGPDLGHFAAIGSGKQLAQAIFRPHLATPRDLTAGRVLAYRVLGDAIALAAGGLGEPIHIFAVGLNGDVHKIENGERKAIRDTCELWRAVERDSLAKVLAPVTTPVPLVEIPQPA